VKRFIGLVIVLAQGAFVSAQFSDDFSDGDFTSSPTWVGQTDRFLVNELGELQLSAPAEVGESYLVIVSSEIDDASWEFVVKMGFQTSNTSYTKVYLMTDQADLTGNLNGYFVLIGETEDEVSLWRQDGISEVMVIDGVDKSIEASSVNVRVKVTRDASGNWELLRDATGGNDYFSEGTTTDVTYTSASFFGVRCRYTASRSNKFFFDDFFAGQDNFPPEIASVTTLDKNSIEVGFNENLDVGTVQGSDFSIDQGVLVTNIVTDGSVVILSTSDLTNGRTYELMVNEVADEAGNEIVSNSMASFQYLVFSEPENGELLLSEILFNPRTGGVDFVELVNNTSDKYFDLQGWNLARIDAENELDQVNEITDSELALEPGQYVALSEDSENLVFEYPKGEASRYFTVDDVPSYNDDEGTVVLLSPSLDTIQFFHYSEGFHYELLEDEEGVSLERISFEGDENNPNFWRSAASTEGFATPGKANSQTILRSEAIGELTIDPKVFLPGNSGTGRDFTTINYSFDQGGKFANVIIYDQSGRQVKELVNGASLGTSGFFRWDGTTDRGSLARMGYHVVVFEVFDGNGNTDLLKETVVVGRDF